MDEAREADAGNVAALAVHSLEVPDCLRGRREVISQEATSVVPVECSSKSPLVSWKRAQLQVIWERIEYRKKFSLQRWKNR